MLNHSGSLVNGFVELEGIVGKFSSKRVYEIGLFLVLIHHHPMTSRKLKILFVHYKPVSFFFKVLFHEFIFFKHSFKYLLYRDLYKIYIGDDCHLFLVIFRDLSCFIHKNVVVKFHVYFDIYRVR